MIRVTLTLDVADGTHPLEWDWATLLDLGPDETVEVERGMSQRLIDVIDAALDDRGLYLDDAPADDFGNEDEYRQVCEEYAAAMHEWRNR